MNLPKLNPGGYINASISNVAGFHKVDYLLAHGSADDNVHYANSAHLLDMFTKAQVRNFRFRMFTDRWVVMGCYRTCRANLIGWHLTIRLTVITAYLGGERNERSTSF